MDRFDCFAGWRCGLVQAAYSPRRAVFAVCRPSRRWIQCRHTTRFRVRCDGAEVRFRRRNRKLVRAFAKPKRILIVQCRSGLLALLGSCALLCAHFGHLLPQFFNLAHKCRIVRRTTAQDNAEQYSFDQCNTTHKPSRMASFQRGLPRRSPIILCSDQKVKICDVGEWLPQWTTIVYEWISGVDEPPTIQLE